MLDQPWLWERTHRCNSLGEVQGSASWTWKLRSWWYLSYPNLSIYRDLGEWLWVAVSLIWQWLQLQLLFQMWSLFVEAEQLLPYPVFYSVAICKVHQKRFLFTWKSQQYTFTVLPMGYVISPSLWHNIVLRNFDSYHSLQHPRVHYTDDIILIESEEQEEESTLNALVRHMQIRRQEIYPHENLWK